MLADRDELLRRFYAKDPAHDGTFLVGVVTTGIYCLPSCRARDPRPENVRFFEDERGARSSGLRPCRRCKPDEFYRGFDPDLASLRALAGRVRDDPAAFADAGALARGAGFGATKLNALFRRHFHATPSAFLQRARIQRAMQALRKGSSPLDAAHASGFESASTFYENFAASVGLTPRAYGKLGENAEFVLSLPAGFRRDELLAFFTRDPEGRTERAGSDHAVKALSLEGRPARLSIVLGPGKTRIRVESTRSVSPAMMFAAHAACRRLLGLGWEPGPFERAILRSKGLARLVHATRGLRPPQVTDLFEGLIWVIVGQQVNVAFAATCRARLIRLAGRAAGAGFIAPPAPQDVARLEPADLERLQFSRRKAEYLIDAARAIAAGELVLDDLSMLDAGSARERLGAIRGLGPWSVEVLMMRVLGFEDCVPLGDSGLGAALQRFFALAERPDERETLRRMEPFVPWRSFATFHLWKSLELAGASKSGKESPRNNAPALPGVTP